jgi:hypothetical protein
MFEKIRIRQHMEIVNAAGQHLGTVDDVDGDTIKLTRSDSADARHHYIDFAHVDRIEDNRVYLKDGAPAPEARAAVAGGQFQQAGARQFSDGQEFGTGERIDPATYSTQSQSVPGGESPPLFGPGDTGSSKGA